MDKTEAIAILKELFVVCPEIGQAVFVSLDPDIVDEKANGSCKIRMRIDLDNELRDRIKNFLCVRKLELTETRGLSVIFSSAQ